MFRKRVIESALSELAKRSVAKPKTIRSVACLVDIKASDGVDPTRYFQELFDLSENKTSTIFYVPRETKEHAQFSPQFNNRHLHWDGTLLHPMLDRVTSHHFDLLVNYFVKDNLPLQSISSNINAQFRVGFSTVDHRLNDFMLGEENFMPDKFINTFRSFFSKIKTDG